MQLDPDVEEQWLRQQVRSVLSLSPSDAGSPLKIGLAVSGGGDSLALLHLFAADAEELGIELCAATVDHGLRLEARAEAAFVAQACAQHGIKHWTLTWENDAPEANLQALARAARYRLLADWGRAQSLELVALGHTQDDVAETFLMRLSRGSGLDGLAAMEPRFVRQDMGFIRPFLALERDMLRRFLTRHGHSWCEDPSNEDTRFQRVRARRVLAALAPLGLSAQAISTAATELGMAKSALQRMTWEHAEKIVEFQGGDIVVGLRDWRLTHPELQRRLLNAMLQWVGATEFPPRADAVMDLSAAMHETVTQTLNGCLVTQTTSELRVAREYNAVNDLVCAAEELWDNRWVFEGGEDAGLELRALGEDGLKLCPDWRETGLPRRSLLATPALWRGAELVSAPVAGLSNGWCARLTRSREQFLSRLLSH